ncbi:MAG: hypothetical protein WCK89_05195, partial [bacterium]
MSATHNYSGSLVADEWDAQRMGIKATYASQTDLDRFFANGDFKFSLSNLVDGVKTVTLSMGATNDYPAVPTVTNLVRSSSDLPRTPHAQLPL